MSHLPESITQTNRHYSVSDRYTSINTESIITSLEDHGFTLDTATQARVRKEENKGFQKHLVTLKYSAMESKEGVPTVVIRNSHNRSSGLSLFTGFIRFACLNGLILGNDINQFNIRHKKDWLYDVNQFVNDYQNNLTIMKNQHKIMENRRMSSFDEKLFTQEAAKLRYDLTDYMDYRELSHITRQEDRGDSLWIIFNRVQENLLKGEFERCVRTIQEDGSLIESWGKAKLITNTDEIVRINRSLYDIAMSYTK